MTRSVNDTKALQWQQRFRSFDSSNLSVRKFCSLHRLSVHSFQYWSRRLNRNAKPSNPAKMPVVAQSGTSSEITIELGSHVSIRIPAAELGLAKSILQMALSLRAESSSFQPVVVRG